MIDGPIIALRLRLAPGGVWVMDDHNMSLLNYFAVSAALIIFAGPKIVPRGYLPKVGPAPLRYHTPAPPPDQVIPLPPLSMTNEVQKAVQPEPLPAAPATNQPPPAPAAEPAVTNAAPAVVALPAQGDPFSPRMFVQFFNQGGTNSPVSVIAPVPFAPPPSTIPAPPSRANYQLK